MKSQLLLVEDDHDYRQSLRSILELENYKVEEATSIEEGIEKLETMPLDLVLTDLRLADEKDEYDISGLEIAKKVTDMKIPCIVITAYPSIEITRKALSSRGAEPLAVDFVLKADGPQVVLDAINTALGKYGRTSE